MPPSSRRKLFRVGIKDQIRSAWGRLAWPTPGPGEPDDATRGLDFYRSRGARHGLSEPEYPDNILNQNRVWRKQAKFNAVRANSFRAATNGGILLRVGPLHRGLYNLYWGTGVPTAVSLFQLAATPRVGQSVAPQPGEYIAKFDLTANVTVIPFPIPVYEGNFFAIIGNAVGAAGGSFVELTPLGEDYEGAPGVPIYTGAPE